MEDKSLDNRTKWTNLLAFGLLYNMVYLGRFNVNFYMDSICLEIPMETYQQNFVSGSVFISYALGSLFLGHFVDKYGARKTIAIGVCVSIYANIMVSLSGDWRFILAWWLLNGVAQSVIWLGGISLMVNCWDYKQRGFSVGVINFFSGLSHMTAYAFPMILMIIFPQIYWRASLPMSMGVLAIFLIIFYLKVVETPRKLDIEPTYLQNKTPRKYFFKQRNFRVWCVIAMLSSICRYGLLTWIPMYYKVETGKEMLNPIFTNLMFPLGIPIVTDKYCPNNRLPAVLACSIIAGATVFGFMRVEPGMTLNILLFVAGFFIYAINGVVWAYATDVGGRVFAGTAAGILDCAAYLGASVQAVYFGSVLTATGNWNLVFTVVILTCITIAVCAVIAGIGVNKKD